ncbi:uncharacterized protein BDV14DRAFT_205854 [Aspergillus stella-maris]|uniref:uncharacterized protein n=1 Tax=Aspergillus stella-maris TaxID=1810926 RepID=UPI003CCE1558
MDNSASHPPPPPNEPPSTVLTRMPIAVGTTCVIYAMPDNDNKVLKRRPTPNPNSNDADDFAGRAFEIEITCYNRLESHPRIASCHAITKEGIFLERGECLRSILQTLDVKTKYD